MPELSLFNDAQLKKDGRYSSWMAALSALPSVEPGWMIDDGVVCAGKPADDFDLFEKTLKGLMPWRKGPWCLAGVKIDSEWRSDFKWARIKPHLELDNRHILDVGAGNGYFGWQLLAAGARSVTACDPTTLFVMQHQLISKLARDDRHALWAARLEDLPHSLGPFDLVLSMGVLSHRRYLEGHHIAHLGFLYRKLIPGGDLLLETLVVPPEFASRLANGDEVLIPKERYARMRNVYALPTIDTLVSWLAEVGFADIRVADVTATTTEEQRSTAWMPHQSLIDGLSSDDGTLTIEGYPRPMRAIVLARRRTSVN